MKRTNRITVLFLTVIMVLIAGLQGCDTVGLGSSFLKKPPTVNTTKDTVFSSAKYARQFLWNAYRSLPYGPGPAERFTNAYDRNKLANAPLAAITDIGQSYTYGNNISAYYDATTVPYSGSATKYNYNNSGAWDGIRKAYIFINNVDQVPDMDAATKKRLKSEARMIIAVHYTDLFRNFGGVPWVDHAYSANEDFKIPRLTARATLDSTVAMIDRAIPNLPFVLDQPSTESGRFTQAGAMGLKCRLLLFGASPLFNSSEPYIQHEAASQKLIWYGKKDPSLWQQAVDACEALIDKIEQTGAYHLADTGNPREDFQHAYNDRDSPELLIQTRVRYQHSNYDRYYPIFDGYSEVTDNYVKMFPMANGIPINSANSGYDPKHPYKNRDPRLYETVLVNGDEFKSRTAQLWIGGKERENKKTKSTRSGYRMRKFLTVGGHVGNQFPYLRLSEVYLSYAEALNELNGGPTPKAYEYVNKVRNRVDLGDLSPGLSQKEFRKAVLRERALEFGYEEVRWYDMVRWKMKEVFTKTLYGMNICKKGVSPAGVCENQGMGYQESNKYIYSRFKLPPRTWQSNFSPKWYLSAFPKNQVLKQDLVQNPR